jgi:hypothetical protein
MGDNKLVFQVEIKNLKASELKTRHRFREKVIAKLHFHDKKFKTEKQLVGKCIDLRW